MSAVDIDTAVQATAVSGLHYRSIVNIPENLEALNLPIFFPDRDKWYQGTETTPKFWDNAVAEPLQNDRVLQYTFLYSQTGEGRGLADFFSSAVAMLDLLTTALIRLDLHTTRITSVVIGPLHNIPLFGKTFCGASVIVKAREMTV